MARLLFPDDPYIFRVAAPGSPLYSTINDPLVIYLDAGATTLANIQHTDHTPVFNSALMLDGTAVIPQFYGPDGVTTLWAKQPGGEIFPLSADSGPRLDKIENELATGLNFGIYKTTVNNAVVSGIPFTVTHNLNNPYVLVSVWLIGTPGVSGTRLPDASYSVSAVSSTAFQVTTTSSYSAGSIQITVVG